MSLALEELNPPQKEAVCYQQGPLLVLAGAGSGKTRVVTFRIARLILDESIPAGRILAVTFTNKAAREMVTRIESLAGGRARGLWIGTFHSMCARMLRRHSDRLGFPREFSIYDTDEQRDLIKKILYEINFDTDKWQPARVQQKISYCKNHMITPDTLLNQPRREEDPSLARIYSLYLDHLKTLGAMDFDDLLILCNRLMDENPDIRQMYQTQFEHVIVDEYQDTNEPQHLLTQALAEPQRNLCVVGDDDQSIYRWRGAQFQNILHLPKLYPDLKVIRLEQNYRSTSRIIKAAQSVIECNRKRHGKDLFTKREEGQPVMLVSTEDEEQEAGYVASMIREALQSGVPPTEIGILYRTNAQSRVLEEGLIRAGIPYRIIGGLAFYQRKEIKTLLSYLRLLIQPHDDIAFLRIVNAPRRGIGQTTLRQLQARAGALHLSLFETAKRASNYEDIGSSGAQKLQSLCWQINRWSVSLDERALSATLQSIIDETDFETFLKKEDESKAQTRIENIMELKSALDDAEVTMAIESIRPWEAAQDLSQLNRTSKLELFLERVALENDKVEDQNQEAVLMMTLHAAKGLEFSQVFMTGMEEGLFPHAQSFDSEEALEEERRLCYVGMTRAKDRLVLSYSIQRTLFGNFSRTIPSRFLKEIPEDLLESRSTLSAETALQSSEFEFSFEKKQRKGFRSAGAWPRSSSSVSPARNRETASPKIETPDRTPRTQPPSRKDETPSFLKPGAWVRHQTFGIGKVLAVDGSSSQLRVTVQFQIVGQKTVLQKFAKLTPVE